MASGVWLPVSCALFRVICVQLFLRSMNLAAVAGLVVLTTLYPGPCEALEAPDWPVISESLLQDDYECVDFPPDSDDKDIVHWSLDATVPSTGRNYTVHVGSLSSGLPKTFSFQLPDGGESISPFTRDSARILYNTHECYSIRGLQLWSRSRLVAFT